MLSARFGFGGFRDLQVYFICGLNPTSTFVGALSPHPFVALDPKPCTLNRKPQTLNREPQTPNPKLQTQAFGSCVSVVSLVVRCTPELEPRVAELPVSPRTALVRKCAGCSTFPLTRFGKPLLVSWVQGPLYARRGGFLHFGPTFR